MKKRRKVLVVDDCDIARKTIREELENGGYEVIEAKNGLEALISSSVSSPPDLITLDLEMPKFDGFATCRKLRDKHYSRFFKRDKGHMVPIICVTGADTVKDRKKCFEFGAVDFITKPFQKGEILDTVNKILRPPVQQLSTTLTALVVDDNEVVRHIVTDTLKQEGMNVIEAEQGAQAFKIIRNRKKEIDIVITDLVMPEMDGCKLSKKIREELNLKEIPIIFLTAMADQSALLDLFAAGASDYIVKPFAKEELLARITVQVEKNQLNKSLKSMVDKLMEHIQLKDNLLSVCSHDLRNPLNGIIGLADLLMTQDHLDSNVARMISQIKTSGEMMLNLINDILEMGKLESDKTPMERKPVSLSTVIQDSINSTKYMAANKQQTLQFINNSSSDIVLGNYNGLLRMFNNLLSNAIKFTPKEGQIKVILDLDPKERIIVNVIDNGIGIEQEKILTLFDRFTITAQPGTCGETGTGLGMSIIKGIVDRHEGWIDVNSTVGKGTSVTLSFPKALDVKKQKPPLTNNNTLQEHLSEAARLDAPASSETCNILFAEDSSINQEILMNMLNNAGYHAEIANNGKEVVDKYTSSPEDYELILMDVYMPELDGLEATKAIREKGFNTIPIIALTASALKETELQCLDAGMNDIITKPINKERVMEIIKKWVFEKRHSA